MIPVKLAMRNFMCYRDNVPPLYFDGIHLACLSGDNGNGKSALIDAMTWALWGKARASSDDDLVHSGQAEAEVEFEFTVEQQRYRIIRKRSRPKKKGSPGQSALEFQILTGEGFRPITGNTISQTQQKIIDTLHMDYDTFINSAYLRQGHADEFTRQIPARRKEVLGNILGLLLYDELEEQARELARRHEGETTRLERDIEDINAELARKPAYEAELQEAQSKLSSMEATTREKEAEFTRLRQQKESLDNKKVQLGELTSRISNTVKDLERWDEQTRQLQSRIKEYEEVIGRRDVIEDGYAQFIEAKKICEELDSKSQQFYKLEKQKDQLERKITEAGHKLNTEHTLIQSDINKLEIRAQKLSELKAQLKSVQMQIRQLEDSETNLRQKERAIQGIQAQVNYLEVEIVRLKREIDELMGKLDLLSSEIETKCPLCETELSREGLKLISEKYATEKKDKNESLKSKQTELGQKLIELEAMQKEKTQLDSGLNQERIKAQSQVSFLTKEIGDIEAEYQHLSGLRESLNAIEQSLAKKDFAIIEQEALVAIETESSNLAYEVAKHEQARRRLNQLEPYDREKSKLEEAEKLIDQEKEAVSRTTEAAQGMRQNLEIDNQKKEELAAELVQLPQVLDDLTCAEKEYRNVVAQRNQAQENLGSVKAKIQRCSELEIKRQDKEAQVTKASKETSIYKELAQAFSKTGVQALLIEMTLPEIENEANRLLGRMTDNRMHVRFETQRETKKGSIQETLDINIADELGTRNYEMFSGGESFRINFAIRIALSRLLAKRAGAPLPTLIIDEGFGTQDSTGMEKLQEAIKSIQDNFDKILVITHMDELKDSFPTRIDVIKTAEGSAISVN